MINSWVLYHEEFFWKGPGDDGQLHVVPSWLFKQPHSLLVPQLSFLKDFARIRVFLWTAAVTQKFKIMPYYRSDKG